MWSAQACARAFDGGNLLRLGVMAPEGDIQRVVIIAHGNQRGFGGRFALIRLPPRRQLAVGDELSRVGTRRRVENRT